MDFWRLPHDPHQTVDIMVKPTLQANLEESLDRHQLPYNVIIDNVQDVIDGQHGSDEETDPGLDSFDYSRYHTYEEVGQCLLEATIRLATFLSENAQCAGGYLKKCKGTALIYSLQDDGPLRI